MNVKLSLIPFSDVWTYCTLNDLLSIICTSVPEWRVCALNNAYEYSALIRGQERDLQISWNPSYGQDIESLFHFTDITLNPDQYEKQLMEYINNGRILYVLIDPYYWLPNRFAYHIEHSHHYQMLTGYNLHKQTFYFYTDTNTGYCENEVTFDKLREAIVFDSEKSTFVEITGPDSYPSYTLTARQCAENAQVLTTNLAELSYMTHWMGCSDNIAHPFYTIGKIADRQFVNGKLIEYLASEKILPYNISTTLYSSTQTLESYWKFTKSLFQIAYMRHRPPDYAKINAVIGTCLELEYRFWEDLLSIL